MHQPVNRRVAGSSPARGATFPSKSKNTQRRFLDRFAVGGIVSRAAVEACIGRRTHYNWLETDAEYAAQFREAEQDAADVLLAEARRRAMRHSDRLLIELLRGFLPERFARRHEHTGEAGGPIKHVTPLDPKELMTHELEAIVAIYARLESLKGEKLRIQSR